MSTDRHDPLDADERELARVLRALPAGEPPSALDARILAMARDAVVSTPAQKDEGQPRARRAQRLAWGLGVAASCVIAAGLVWRMGGLGTESVDLLSTERDTLVERRSEAERSRAQATMRAAPASSETAVVEAATAAATLDRISVSGTRVEDTDAVRVIAEDSHAAPEAWIQRIRSRIERGDAEGARQSLQGFIERHPRHPLPQDVVDFGRVAGIDGLPRDGE